MARPVAERPRRGRPWLRRLETGVALRLPIERLHAERATLLEDPTPVVGPPEGLGVSPIADSAARWTCDLVLGPGGTVALSTVDARKAARAASVARPRTAAGPAAATRSRPPAEPGLSLAERLLLVLQPPLESLLKPEGVLEWPGPLYPYQHEGVHALIERDALLLADDMGLGKTIQAIAALRALIHLRRVERALVVAPAGLLSQWRRELERWAPESRTTAVRGLREDRLALWRARSHVFVVSYETLRQDIDAQRRYGPNAIEWDVVVLDEAQKIKNPATQAARACKGLRRRAAWALTGTPVENDLSELASIVQFLTPVGPRRQQPSLLWGEDLLARHRELQLRRRKHEVLQDLPPKSVNDLWLQLGKKQRQAYERAKQEGVVYLRGLGENITIANVLALIQKLKQICNVCPETGESAKLADLSERIDEIAAEGGRALVFSQYVDEDFGVLGISRRLEGVNPLVYHGSLTQRRKDEVVSAFKNSPRHKALLLSLRAGGHGLNLQEASYVFHFDRWWNPAVERQAEDRAHRLGQKSAVTVYRYICEDTIEERIHRILQEKQYLFDEYVDKVTIDPGKLFGEKEIFGLLGLEPPLRGGGTAMEELAA